MKRFAFIAAAASVATLAAILVTDETDSPATISQPTLNALNLRTRRRLAPSSRRVDLVVPSYSKPTSITNPLFPIGSLRSAVLVGRLGGRPWRAETTLLPGTKTVDWKGRHIATLRSQFVAYLDGRIYEVAVDLYAQADDGSVWYLGEDAYSYEHGVVAETEGTWRAGVDGPPAMIMPAHPRIGDVYRTENIPGLVFEEVTVERLGVTVSGPSGPIKGALVGRELHMDEARLEDKIFAPGYGEFHSGAGRTFEATALAVPADARSGQPPPELLAVSTGADHLIDAARSRNWRAALAIVDDMKTAWAAIRPGEVPARLAAQMTDALDAAVTSVHAGRVNAAGRAAVAAAEAGLDLQLSYRAPSEIDRARFDLHARELILDAATGDAAAVRGDVATLTWIRDRVTLGRADARRIDHRLRSLEAAARAGQLGVAIRGAAQLRKLPAR
ncbi:MAG: hypothetical protein WAQ33_05580 [Gaiellaceae bacterium]